MKKFLVLILLFLACNSISFAQTDQEIFENGVLLFKQGLYQKAIDQFSELIERAPENADAYKNRGVSYMKLEKYDLAIKDFQKAKVIFPELKDLYSNLGVAWYYKKNCEKAIENYNIEIQMSPENAVAYFNRALCLVEQGKTALALEDLGRTLELQPDFYWALCFKGDLLAAQGDPVQAIEMYEQAIQVDPDNAYPSEKMALLKDQINENEKLVENTDKSVSSGKKPPVPEARDLLKSGYSLQAGAFQNPSNARKMNQRLIEKGFDSRILTLTGKNDTTWYVVRVGSFEKKADAERIMAELKQKAKISAIIRPVGQW